MNRALAYWIYFALGFLTFIVLLVGIEALLSSQVEAEARSGLIGFFSKNPALIFVPLILNGVAAFLAFRAFLADYVLPIRKMSEEASIQTLVNAAYRLPQTGGRQVRRLANAINAMADQHQQLQENFEIRLEKAKEQLSQENDVLTALVSGLNEGVLVFNLKGELLLYNQKSREFFSSEEDETAKSSIGLNRSIYNFLDRDQIHHGIGTLKQRLQRKAQILPYLFASAGAKGQLLRMQLFPVLDDVKKIEALVLLIHDITEQVERDNRREQLLSGLEKGLRTSISHIRAAIEAISDYRMASDQKDKFLKIIQDESSKLSGLVDQVGFEHAGMARAGWEMDKLRISTLGGAVEKLLSNDRIKLQVESEWPDVWLKIDSYQLTKAIVQLLNFISTDTGVDDLHLKISIENRLARWTFSWMGKTVEKKALKDFRQSFVVLDKEKTPFTIQEVFDRHEAELWADLSTLDQQARLNLIIPLANPPAIQQGQVAVIDHSRPEFYDLNLFQRDLNEHPQLEMDLENLTFTVFDTETTGMNPAGGDEILSIGAVRVVNGRMLRSETFDQLVRPTRPIPQESIEIHGIQSEMLRNQPDIATALKAFHDFAKDSVLVAHNAAFDMRFLSIFEVGSGVTFDHPLLDTLLLSAVAHPNQDRHNLDAIADRFGVTIIGRHTALGDSLVTAEILLKLLPVLKSHGISTLKQAQEASRDTYYARIKY